MTRRAVPRAEVLGPLAEFYRERGLPLPHLSAVEPDEIPEPYRRLLAHAGTMTPALEGFLGQRLTLKVLLSTERSLELRRQVVLLGVADRRPAELGSIRIHLSCFEQQLREQVRQGRVPLGRLLDDFSVSYVCRLAMFFQTRADMLMSRALGVALQQPLFGRCNHLLDGSGRMMAEVVEILPLFQEAPPERASVAG